MAQESMVLLQNNNDLLPLKKDQTIAVIGPLANDKASQLGAWAGNGQAKDAVTPLEGIAPNWGKTMCFMQRESIFLPLKKGLRRGWPRLLQLLQPALRGWKATTNRPALKMQ